MKKSRILGGNNQKVRPIERMDALFEKVTLTHAKHYTPLKVAVAWAVAEETTIERSS